MVNYRALIRVDLEVRQPWAIGGLAGVRDEVGLPILVDPRQDGPPAAFLPATSLVGSLRRHLGVSGSDWLGADESSEEKPATPSRLRCLGVDLSGADGVLSRQTTKIDARRRAADPNMLRAEEWVDASDSEPTKASWWLQVDRPCDALTELLTELWNWRPIVGRRRSVGHGDAIVTGVHYTELDLATPEHLTWWLTGRHVWAGAHDGQPPGWQSHDRPDAARPDSSAESMVVAFVVEEPLFVGRGDLKVERRSNLQTTWKRIPGSSWKGIFRHRVEHVLRVAGYSGEGSARIVETLFGSPRRRGASEDAGVRGKLRFFDSDLLAAATITRTHVAIDRVTGGASDRSGKPGSESRGGALFSVEAVAPDTAVDLRIDSQGGLSDFERLLLEHVIADIHDRLIGVGGLTSRGYGTLRLHAGRAAPKPVPAPTGTDGQEAS